MSSEERALRETDSETPLVSAIVPTRDRLALLEQALSSIGAQTYDRIETIIVDGSAAPIPPGRITAALGRSTRLVYQRGPRRGAAAARNAGITAARGEYLAFLDDDDQWDESKIERQVTRFQQTGPDVGVIYTGQRSVDSAGRTLDIRCPRTGGDVTEELLRGAKMTPFSAVMVRANLVGKTGLLDEQLPAWEDLDWYIRLSKHCVVESIPEPLVIRRMGDHVQLTDQFESIRDVVLPRFIDKHRGLAATYGPACERALVASRLLDVAHAGLEQGHYVEALKLLTDSFRNSPFSVRTYPYLLAAVGGPVTYRPVRWVCRRLADKTAPP